jgi:hypothetical protein
MSKPTAKDVTELYQAARQLLLNTERTPFLEKSLDRVRDALEPFEKSRRGTLDVGCNDEQALYVIPNPSGYSCLGYDVCLPPEARGTIRGYKAYQTLLQRADSYCQRNKLRCPVELTPELTGLEGKRVEVVDRYGERRRFIVGKSTGWLPIHLEIARRNSTGGPAVTGAPFQSVRIVA